VQHSYKDKEFSPLRSQLSKSFAADNENKNRRPKSGNNTSYRSKYAEMMESKKKSDRYGYQPSLKARELESGMSNRHLDLRKPAV